MFSCGVLYVPAVRERNVSTGQWSARPRVVTYRRVFVVWQRRYPFAWTWTCPEGGSASQLARQSSRHG